MTFSQPVVKGGVKLISPKTINVLIKEKLAFHRNSKLSVKFETVPLKHPAKKLKDVLNDVLRGSNIDESYAFLNIGQFNANLLSFQRFFLPSDPRRRILYAMKANPEKSVLETFIKKGIDGFDCASWQEIEKVLALGMDAKEIYFNNPIQRRSHLEKAFKAGVSYVTIQSMSGVNRVLDVCKKIDRKDIEIAIRVDIANPDAEIVMSNEFGKYGCDLTKVGQLLKKIKKAGLKPGLAIHLGSQNLNPSSFKKAINQLAQLAKSVNGVSSINLGGGFPVSHRNDDKYFIDDYFGYINEALSKIKSGIFSNDNSEKKIIIEPGRGLSATGVDLLIPVIEIRGEDRIYFASSTFGSFIDHFAHDWEYCFDVYTHDGRTLSKKLKDYKVFGQTCDPRDGFKNPIKLPVDIKEGDFLWMKNAGAYVSSLHNNLNDFEMPKQIVFNTKG